jgi:hypothetical protein
MEKQIRKVNEENLREICKEAGVSTDELFVEDGDEYITWEGILKLMEFCKRENIEW